MTDDAVPRIASQKTASEMLRVSTRRLREMQTLPWWRPEFRTEDGYDVCEILRAQLKYQSETLTATLSPDEVRQMKQRQLAAKVAREEAEQEIAELRASEQRLKAEMREGNVLPLDVYAAFTRELLGMIRTGLEDLPFRLSRDASPSVRSFVYTPPEKIRTEKDIAPVQREIQKLIRNIETWLNDEPEETG
jgi:hypothetical protein